MSDAVILMADGPVPVFVGGGVGPEGDPGGNVMAIGLKTAAGSMTIDAGTNVIRTSGYNATDIGPAFYTETATIDIYRPGTPISPALTVIKGMRRTDDLVAGMAVSGEGVPASTTLLSINSPSQITLSAAVTTANTKVLRFHARAINAGYAALYPESVIFSANARYFHLSRSQIIQPEMLGAVGDGATDDYAAFVAFNWFVSNSGGGRVSLAPSKTYYIGQYQTAGNGVIPFRIQGVLGLDFNFNGSKLDFKGNFDRDVSTTVGIGYQFANCVDMRLYNGELDGNVEQTTNTSNSTEHNSPIGMRFGSCEDYVIENIHCHHFSTDGLKVDADSETYSTYTDVATYNKRAGRRGKFINCQSRFNGRQGLTVGCVEYHSFELCHFTDTAQFTGTYGVGGAIGHAPKSGTDFEPTDNKSVQNTLDVDPNNIHFSDCLFRNNRGGDWKAATENATHTLSFTRCRVEVASNSTTTSSINIGIPYTFVRDCYLDMKHTRFELRGGGAKAITIVEGNEIRANGATEIGFYAANNSAGIIVRNNRIIGTATAPSSVNLFTLNDNALTFEDNYVFVPAAGYVDGGASDDDTVGNLSGIRRAENNRYVTDLAAAAGSSSTAHYVVNHATAEAVNEKFVGAAPGIADTFRPVAASTFNTTYKFSKNRPGFLGVPGKLSATDAALTYQHGRDPMHVELNVPITANRTVTLSATDATEGAEVESVRTAAATGAFNWTVGAKVVPIASWARHRYSGGAWTLIAFGAL